MLVKTLQISGELAENYAITSEGDVFNLKTGRKLKLQSTGYKHIRIPVNGVYSNVRVHRAVAETFLSNPKGFKVVNHKDGNKENNKLSNLEWTSQSENVLHSIDLRRKSSNLWIVKKQEGSLRKYSVRRK